MKKVPIIQLHIPKTAGSTTRNLLLPAFAEDEVFSCGDNQFNVSHYKSNVLFTLLPDEEKRKYKFITGHVEYLLIQDYPEQHFSFTFLRHPVKRTSSMFYYLIQNKKHYLHKVIVENDLSLADFCRSGLLNEIDNGMCRRLSGVANSIPYGACNESVLQLAKYNLTKNISFFGLQECFDESLFLFLYFIDALELLQYKTCNVTQKKKKSTELTKDEKAAIRECNVYDMELYAYARQLYASRYKDLKRSLAKPLDHYLRAMRAAG